MGYALRLQFKKSVIACEDMRRVPSLISTQGSSPSLTMRHIVGRDRFKTSAASVKVSKRRSALAVVSVAVPSNTASIFCSCSGVAISSFVKRVSVVMVFNSFSKAYKLRPVRSLCLSESTLSGS